MTPILFLTAFLAALAVIGLVWSAAIAGSRADALMEAYASDQRHEEETAGGR